MDETCTIDDQPLAKTVRPATPAELGEHIRRAAGAGHAVFPLGGRTNLGLGLPPSRQGVGVDLTALSNIIDYPARDMTITVQAGIRFAELSRLLSTEGQRLPIDIPNPARSTLGGALAVNTSGPRRLGAGTLRDYVIGITTVNDQGQETKAGGRVVKNVAGYDLCKLHTGALGTLGVISQVTLKVRPQPEAQALLTFGCDGAPLQAVLDHLHQSRTRPMCIDVLNAAAARFVRGRSSVALPGDPWVVIVGYEDSEEAVNWQIQQLLRELTAVGVPGVEALAGASTSPLWEALSELTAPDSAKLSLKANLLPARTADFSQLASRQPGGPLVHAHVGSGVVRAHFTGDVTLAEAQALLGALADAADSVTLPRCPVEWKRELPVWGRARGDWGLMRKVKQALDPGGLFNPGRFVGGI